jgi:hypothetical protein
MARVRLWPRSIDADPSRVSRTQSLRRAETLTIVQPRRPDQRYRPPQGHSPLESRFVNTEMATNIRKNIDDIYVRHELTRREAFGQPFTEPIWAVQVILANQASQEPTVRLNREVRLRVQTPDSNEWRDYLDIPIDGPSQIRHVDLYPEEREARHLTYFQTGISPDHLVWLSVGDPELNTVQQPGHERAANYPFSEEAWGELMNEHDRVSGLVLGSINSPEPSMPIEVIMATALQRSRHLLEAYIPMLVQRNLTAGSALIRMQLDSVMRVNAIFLVPDPLILWDVLRTDRPWSLIVDRDGNQLRDVYLHQKLSERFGWASEVYGRMSGYVHLSRPHLEATASSTDSFLGMQIVQGPAGANVSDERLHENAALFMQVTSALLTICEEYATRRSGSG